MTDRFTEVLREADAFFEGRSKVHRTLDSFAERMNALGVDFAVAGALAANARGHIRMTVDVDVIMTAEGLTRFKDAWLGRGYVEKFAGSRGVRDTQTGVIIDVLLAGGYPGDGKPKPMRFPDPSTVSVGPRGLRYLDLRTLIELKLASGISAAHRLQDLADVIALIRVNSLGESYAETLDESVREKYGELWRAAQVKDDDY
jgi:hypothetical protein